MIGERWPKLDLFHVLDLAARLEDKSSSSLLYELGKQVDQNSRIPEMEHAENGSHIPDKWDWLLASGPGTIWTSVVLSGTRRPSKASSELTLSASMVSLMRTGPGNADRKYNEQAASRPTASSTLSARSFSRVCVPDRIVLNRIYQVCCPFQRNSFSLSE